MSKLLNQWIDLFRAGNYGEKGNYSEQDLQQIVDSYDPAKHEAPAVIGHPKSDGPAYGWFDQLRRVGDLLQGKMRQVEPTFEDAVQQGRYKKRSVSLYGSPGSYSLRHVGFLGAQPPEIKGLADIAFEQEDQQAVEIEFSEEMCMPIEEKDKQSIADVVFEKLKGIFPAAPKAAEGKAFSEEDQQKAIAAAVDAAVKPIQEALDAQHKSFSEKQTADQAAASKSRSAQAVAGLKTAGKWVPAFEVIGVQHVFDELAKIDATVEFSEGEKAVKKTPLEIMVAFMESQPKIVPAGRAVETAAAAPTTVRSFGEGADNKSVQLNHLAEELEKKERISFAEAVRRVGKEHPELLITGGAAAGSV